MTKIEEILCTNFGIDVQNIEDDEQGLCAMIEYDTHRSYTLPEPLLKGIKQYAEWYCQQDRKNIIKNMEVKHVYSDSPREKILTYGMITDYDLKDLTLPSHD